MLSTHLIVDEFARNGRVGFFWKKIAPKFMAHIAPAQVSQTHSQDSVAPLIEEAVKNGARKIILIGDERTLFVGLNALMRFPQNLRQKFAIGLWPLRDWDMLFYPIKGSHQLAVLAQVFKAGHTFPLDLAKVALSHKEQPVQELYFGRHCEFSYVQTFSQNPAGGTEFFNAFARFIPFHIPIHGQLTVEYQSFSEEGGLKIRVLLHPFALHSLGIPPNDLRQHARFLLLWQKGLPYAGQWLERPAFHLQTKQGLWGRASQKSCLSIKVDVWNGPLSIKLDGQPHLCTSAQFELKRKALPVIIKMAPVRLKETAKVWGNLKSKAVVARRQPISPCRKNRKARGVFSLQSKRSF